MSVRKFGEWVTRTLAVAALFLAFKPSDALAATTTNGPDAFSITSDDVSSVGAADILVDQDDETVIYSE